MAQDLAGCDLGAEDQIEQPDRAQRAGFRLAARWICAAAASVIRSLVARRVVSEPLAICPVREAQQGRAGGARDQSAIDEAVRRVS